MREEDLLQSLQEGHEEAYHFLFNTYYRRLVAFAFGIVKETEQAKDVVQNCFVKLYHKRGELVQVNNINAYLYKIVYHEALNYVRA
jgi:DNA-directed RNA polymerase specialized sigma24 family protein